MRNTDRAPPYTHACINTHTHTHTHTLTYYIRQCPFKSITPMHIHSMCSQIYIRMYMHVCYVCLCMCSSIMMQTFNLITSIGHRTFSKNLLTII